MNYTDFSASLEEAMEAARKAAEPTPEEAAAASAGLAAGMFGFGVPIDSDPENGYKTADSNGNVKPTPVPTPKTPVNLFLVLGGLAAVIYLLGK